VNSLLGTSLSDQEIRGTIEPIGFASEPIEGGHLVTIPSWRYDCAVEVDVIEEVARHWGYSRIGKTVPPAARTGHLTERQAERRHLRRVLAGLGLAEAMPLPFLAPGQLERCGLLGDGIEIANPLVAEESVLRTSLLPGLVGAIAYNSSHRNLGVGLYEIGHVFRVPPEGAELPDEREHLGVALGGRDAAVAVRTWHAVVEALALPGTAIENGEVPGLHPTRSATILLNGAHVGDVGEIDPAVLDAHGVAERVGWLEVNLGALLDGPHGERLYRKVSRFPSSDLDLAFEVDESVPATAVEDLLRAAAGDLLSSIRLFDVFRGGSLGEGRRSLAFALRLQAADHTLTDDELASLRQRAIDAVTSQLGATLRG
jgi:phenylalanyl-tRNA synthetase beta chain